MKHTKNDIRLFKQIAAGFHLTEGEIQETLKLPSEGLKNAIKDCFRQIEKPREKFTAEDYDYLTKEIGCVNLEEQLENEPLKGFRTLIQSVIVGIFNMPLKFTASDLLIATMLDGYDSMSTVMYTLDLLSHPKVKYLIKDGEYYSLNLNAKIG